MKHCRKCSGSGRVSTYATTQICPSCGGTGFDNIEVSYTAMFQDRVAYSSMFVSVVQETEVLAVQAEGWYWNR